MFCGHSVFQARLNHFEAFLTSPSRSGVFQQPTNKQVELFTESISFDNRLFRQDIRGSIAHVQMLAKVGLVSRAERDQIIGVLGEIEVEFEQEKFTFQNDLEDVHMHIEHALIERLGDVGRKLHTGRSRNDQVSTDLRLWIRDTIDALDDSIADLQKAFVGRCDSDRDTILPAYTHLQRAQPVLASHYWLAYCEKLQRDRDRLSDCRRRVNVSSLGTAALAGTTLPIDRNDVAERLGFESVAANSLDVSGDRDFVLEFAFVMTLIASHLSSWTEEWILWSTVEFGFIRLPQEFCTGSSIMPQKINPDVLELIRGKTARVIGNLQTLLVLVKGLPMAYNRDLQEDKPRLFDSVDTVRSCLELAAPLVVGATLDRDSIGRRLDQGFLDATTLMEHLISLDIPQRTAHQLVGSLVAEAIKEKCRLTDLSLETFQQADSRLTEEVYKSLGVANAIRAFRSFGSTAPKRVAKQVNIWKTKLNIDVGEPA